MVLAYWGFVLMSLHAGTHLEMPLGKLKKMHSTVTTMLKIVLAMIGVYGIYAFIKR